MQRIPIYENVNDRQTRRFSAGGVFDAAGLQDLFLCMSQNLWLLILSIVMIILIAFHTFYSGHIFLIVKIFLCIGGIVLFCAPSILDSALMHIFACIDWTVILIFDTVWCILHLNRTGNGGMFENIYWEGIAIWLILMPIELIFIIIHFRLFRYRRG